MAEPEPEEPNPAWIERVVAIAGALGFNKVRVRWKLQRGVNRRREARRSRDNARAHVQYEHKVCPQCHAVNDRSELVCTRCKTELHSRPREIAGRLGLRSPLGASLTTLISLLIVAVYVRTAIASGSRGVDIPIGVLLAHGGNLPLGFDEEWWRVATSVFLHAGIIHLAFNLVSLAVVGPMVEEQYGRGFGLLMFLVTGAGAAVISRHTGLDGVGIGASGAVMGLIGMVAGAGHRSESRRGKSLRDDMLKWALFVMVFGFMVGADNRAHLGGFALGAVVGLVVKPAWLTRATSKPLRLALGTIALVAAAATVTAAIVPLTTPAHIAPWYSPYDPG